ncbi:DUF6950 family protein [Aeromonas veronii]|uniref:DUF6950 family protein n=1 Tax=Aeromonas veronii TaxID=654 RepID=UPI003D1A8A1B
MNPNKFLEVFAEYNGMVHGHGVYDCNLMVLKATGYDVESIPSYSTAMGGLKSLRSFGFRRMGEYLEAKGYHHIDPVFISDFDIVLDGIHCGIYFDGRIFALSENKRFGFIQLDRNEFNKNKKIKVFKWQV